MALVATLTCILRATSSVLDHILYIISPLSLLLDAALILTFSDDRLVQQAHGEDKGRRC